MPVRQSVALVLRRREAASLVLSLRRREAASLVLSLRRREAASKDEVQRGAAP